MPNINRCQRVVRYPKFVLSSKITERGNITYRFLLTIPFNNVENNKFLVVILKNPSIANAKTCDNTISKVCNVAFRNGYGGVKILNLFPYRSTNARNVTQFYLHPNYVAIMKQNLFLINTVARDADVVFAWGTNTISACCNHRSLYDQAIRDVVIVVSRVAQHTFYVDRCKCFGCNCPNLPQRPTHRNIRYPLHGLRWHNSSSLIPY